MNGRRRVSWIVAAGAFALLGLAACTALLGVDEATLANTADADGGCTLGAATCGLSAPCAVDLQRDPENCGACGVRCGGEHASGRCDDGVCALACDPGFCDGDGLRENGCEAPLRTDPKNCGSCKRTCGGGRCADGVCQPVLLATFLGGAGALAEGLDPTSVYVFAKQAAPPPDAGVLDGGAVFRVGLDGRVDRVRTAPTTGDRGYTYAASSWLAREGDELLVVGSDEAATTWRVEATDLRTGTTRCITTFPARAPGGFFNEIVALDVADGGLRVASVGTGTAEVRSFALDASCAGAAPAPVFGAPWTWVFDVRATRSGSILLSAGPELFERSVAGVIRKLTTAPVNGPRLVRVGGDVFGAFSDGTLRRIESTADCTDAGPCGAIVAQTAIPNSGGFGAPKPVVAANARHIVVLSSPQLAIDPTTGAAVSLPLDGLDIASVSETADGDGLFVATNPGDVYFLRMPR